MVVRFKRTGMNSVVPVYMSAGAAGCDVGACLNGPIRIEPGDRVAVPTGIMVEIPNGYEIQVRPRSGLAFKKGLTIVNAPGTIDSDYRGELQILMINLGQEPVTINPMDRIAQLVIQKIEQVKWVEVDELLDSARGSGGFGSTDTRTNSKN